jgi:hypothetical protein
MKHTMLLTAALLVAPVIAPAQANDEIRFVSALLNQLQGRSFEGNREYCGFIGLDDDDRWVASRVIQGSTDECTPEWPDDFDPIASFHTHGGFDRGAYSEVPSVMDIEADEEDGVDGWVSTPGGRLWFIDTTDMVVSQICGIGCLMQDPKFVQGAQGRVEQSYTYEEMLALEAE